MAIQKEYLDYTGLSTYTSNIKTYISTAIASAIDTLDVSTIVLASFTSSTFSFLPGMKETDGKIEAEGTTSLIKLGFNYKEPETTGNRNYKVQLTDNHDAYVTVPWTHESTSWRAIQINGTDILASNNSTALNLIASGGISIASDGNTGKAIFSHSNSSITSVTANSFLKFAYDTYGHITSSTAVALSDLTGLGAEASSNKTSSYASTVTDTNYFGALTVYNEIEEVRTIAQGKVKAYVTNTTKMSSLATSAASVTLSSFIDKSGTNIPITDFKIGDNIYLEDENYPDRWVQSTTDSNITVYKLETEKPTLANQTVTTSNVTFDASAAVQFLAGNNVSIVGNSSQKTITINSSYVDTKNTAGATWSTSALYLIGALSSGTNPQTYANEYIYASGSTLHITETANEYAELNHSRLFITDNGSDNNYALITPGNLSLAGTQGGVLLNNGGLIITTTGSSSDAFINLDINGLLFNTTSGSFGFAADFSDPNEEVAALFAKNSIYYLPLYSTGEEVTLAVTEDLVNTGNYQMNDSIHYLTGVQSYSTNNTNSYTQSYANKDIYITDNQLYVTGSSNTGVYTKISYDGIFTYGGDANTYGHFSNSSITFADPLLHTARLEINSTMIQKTVNDVQYDINWPSASGTLALTSQIPVNTNTWRNIKLDGTQILGNTIDTGALDFKASANVSISWSSNKLNFSATNTYSTLDSSGVLTTPDSDTLSPITDASIQALFA